ncbi:MAG: serine protease [Parcubacteria group bacterium]|nr:serine protease [Parcubacteria group bacterium]
METVVVKEEDYIVSAVDANLPSVVTIAVLEKRKSRLGFTSASDTTRRVTEIGIGFALTKDGVIALPNEIFDKGEEFAVGMRAGGFYALTALLKDTASGITLAQAGKPLALAEKTNDDAPEENAVVIDLAKENTTASAVTFVDAKFADSGKIKLGQTAIALGLFNAEPRIILGTISGFGFGEASESKEKHLAVLYTTLASAPLYNGGPLLDSAGSLMGVTLFGAGQTGTAVSSDVAKTLLAKVIEGKESPKTGN